MIEGLDLWHSSDVEARKKINELVKGFNELEKQQERIMLELGIADVDTGDDI